MDLELVADVAPEQGAIFGGRTAEIEFANGDYLDVGQTERWHIQVVSIERIGKEANRWEEHLHLGNDPEEQMVQGTDDERRDRTITFIRTGADRVGRRALAEVAGVSMRETAAILRGERQPTKRTMAKLVAAVPPADDSRS